MLLINSILPIVKLIIKLEIEGLSTKQKQNKLRKVSGTKKYIKMTWTFNIHLIFDPISIVNKSFISVI